MKCGCVERLLSNHLEGRLSRREAGAVAAHLRACRSCRRLRDDIVAVETELLQHADSLPPPGIEGRAVRLWRAQRAAPYGAWDSAAVIPSARARPSWRAPLYTAVLVAALLLAVLGLELPAFGSITPGSRRPRLAALTPAASAERLPNRGMG